MLVYGDAKRTEITREKIAAIRAGLERLVMARPGIERHAILAELLVAAGELEQGLLDRQLAENGDERPSPLGEAAARLTRAVAEELLSSFRTFGSLSLVEPIERALDATLSLDLPATIEVSIPEGYAFYGLYPETYLCAAENALRAGEGPLKVIGIRSIGTGLAAAVAAVAGEEASVVSVRPQGHPFSRTVAIGRELGRELLAEDGVLPRYAVVDEGPGLSGSSFGCVADWLEDRGVAPEAISFYPGHRGGLGPYAGERHRARWERARRNVAEFESVFTSRWPLEGWVKDLTGEPEAPLEDLSAGRWRERLFPNRAFRPATDVQGERRKYLLAAGGRRWLLKFAGLGRYGREKLALAQALGSSRLIPPVTGLRHGFLVGPWLEEARPLPLAPEVDRRTLLDAVATYLAFRAARFPAAPEERGATPLELFEMLVHNTQRALGPAAAEVARGWRGRLAEIARLERPVLTDNKMHAWEWLVTPEGKLLKADALDHHRGNDLVGPQDVAWDLAGAAVELDLAAPELDLLAGAVARRSGMPRAERVQLDFYTLAYLAFQAGRHALAAEALETTAPAEAAGLRSAMERYAERLASLSWWKGQPEGAASALGASQGTG
ncbi:MAG: hypothetical protein DMF53_15390 [Acidobacteria bacterium]|nr:MAG: hypothetical protein DMF53_15390 [Acidobacteriota bacterium]